MALVAILGPAKESSAQSVDPFTTSQASGNAGAPWVSIPNSLFAERQFQRFNNATASLGSGAWTMGANQFSTPTSNGSSYLNYRQDSVGSTIDLSGIASMSFDVTVTGSVNLNWYLEDANGLNLIQAGALVSVSGTGTQTLDFSTATMDPGFDLSAVTGMSVRFTVSARPHRPSASRFSGCRVSHAAGSSSRRNASPSAAFRSAVMSRYSASFVRSSLT
jgi:hypothetical protein